MKNFPFFLCFLFFTCSFGQDGGEPLPLLEEQMEQLAERQETEPDDDFYQQQRALYRKHPLDLNKASESDLKELLLLNLLQIRHFLQYRQSLGNLISVYELQAVPAWNLRVIRQLLPYIKIERQGGLLKDPQLKWWQGEHSILLRTGRVLETAKGFRKPATGSHFTGSREGIYLRYSYNYKNLVRWGFKAEKDPGEPLLLHHKLRFDAYSFYISLRKQGIVESLILGDFTVNLGQGLMQWQTMAFKKSADPANLKRQSPVLRPHTSSGEANFHRGVGATLLKGNWEATAFLSARKISGNGWYDSTSGLQYISSVNLSGYHRTDAEVEDRNNTSQLSAGFSVKYSAPRWHVSANGIGFHFSRVFLEKEAFHNLFAANGRRFANGGIDYSYTNRNLHVFGEGASDAKGKLAFINGLLLALDPKVDISIVQRWIDRSYHSLYANALTESTVPLNEKGVFALLSLRLLQTLTLDMYKDIFRFPWLKFGVDAPSVGQEYFLRLSFSPLRQVSITSRFTSESRSANIGDDGAMTWTGDVSRRRLRIHSALVLSRSVSLAQRWESCWYSAEKAAREQGFLFYQDLRYKNPGHPFSAAFRLTFFETAGYNSRIYVFENQGGTGFAIPAYFGKGYQFYFNLHIDISRIFRSTRLPDLKTACWLHFSHSRYPGLDVTGSGLNEISGDQKNEIRAQFEVSF